MIITNTNTNTYTNTNTNTNTNTYTNTYTNTNTNTPIPSVNPHISLRVRHPDAITWPDNDTHPLNLPDTNGAIPYSKLPPNQYSHQTIRGPVPVGANCLPVNVSAGISMSQLPAWWASIRLPSMIHLLPGKSIHQESQQGISPVLTHCHGWCWR